MIDIERARIAKTALRAHLNRPPWLRGVGISLDDRGSHVIRVMVAAMNDDVRRTVPESFGGVPIVIDVVGNIRPHT